MIDLENVDFSYGEVKVLDNINLHLDRGEALVLIGPSGEGKSTLLKVIAGILKNQNGRVKKNSQRPPSMLFQKNALFDSMTNFENVSFPMKEHGFTDIEKEVSFYLKSVGLSHVPDLYPEEISGGMQKRLGIARALGLKPDIILYDDPTAGLDPITSKGIALLIREQQKKYQSTIISVTNDMFRAYQLGERFGFLYKGKLTYFSTKEELQAAKDPVIYQFIRGLTKGPLNSADFRV